MTEVHDYTEEVPFGLLDKFNQNLLDAQNSTGTLQQSIDQAIIESHNIPNYIQTGSTILFSISLLYTVWTIFFLRQQVHIGNLSEQRYGKEKDTLLWIAGLITTLWLLNPRISRYITEVLEKLSK